MAVKQVSWEDGSGDNLYIDPGEGEGTGSLSVSSDPNLGYDDRIMAIGINTTAGTPARSRLLEITQKGKDLTVITFDGYAITRNDVAVGYEQ